MTIEAVEAIFEHGRFRLLDPSQLALHNGQRVRLVVEIEASTADDILDLAAQVYADLTPQEQQDVERIALERQSFFGDRA